jgi:hypothetical protein
LESVRALLIGLVCSALGIYSVVWANIWWKLDLSRLLLLIRQQHHDLP